MVLTMFFVTLILVVFLFGCVSFDIDAKRDSKNTDIKFNLNLSWPFCHKIRFHYNRPRKSVS